MNSCYKKWYGSKRRHHLIPAIVSTILFFAFSVQAEELSPEFVNSTGLRLFEIGGFIVWGGLCVYFIQQSIRARTLTFGLLLFISSTSMFWQDYYGDWGAYLIYNPKFNLIPWGSTLWTTPNKPWMDIPLYGWFYTPVFLILLRLYARLRTYFPKLSHTIAVLIVTIPIFYFCDLILEGFAAHVGWWSYTHYIGPALVSSKGNMPLLHPILLVVLYGVVAFWVLSLRSPNGEVQFESWFRVEHIRNKASREVARIGVWVLVMNTIYLVVLITPLIAVRELFFDVPGTLVP